MTHRHTSVAGPPARGDTARTLDPGAYERALDGLTGRRDEMVATVQAWSAINSGTGNLDGLAAMDRQVVDAFGRLDAELTPIALPDGQAVGADGALQPVRYGRMLRFSKRPDAPRRVLLTGHTDTVFPADHPFQTTRWLDDTTLNGPGVADMKGGIIVMLHALDALERSGLAEGLGWEVLLSPDEETGSLGSGPVLAERARTAHIGMTYEPALSDGTLAGARKGSGNFTIVLRGKAAHAGREFDKWEDAVKARDEAMSAVAKVKMTYLVDGKAVDCCSKVCPKAKEAGKVKFVVGEDNMDCEYKARVALAKAKYDAVRNSNNKSLAKS